MLLLWYLTDGVHKIPDGHMLILDSNLYIFQFLDPIVVVAH